MRVIRFFLKIALLPVILIVTMIQWFFIFMIGFSSMAFNTIAGLFLLVAVLSYLMKLSSGADSIRAILAGFIVFMIPIVGEAFLLAVIALNVRLRNFLSS